MRGPGHRTCFLIHLKEQIGEKLFIPILSFGSTSRTKKTEKKRTNEILCSLHDMAQDKCEECNFPVIILTFAGFSVLPWRRNGGKAKRANFIPFY